MTSVDNGKDTERIKHNLVLPNDHGQEIPVSGHLDAEDMHFNNATGMLTVEKVFDIEEGKIAYGVISAIGNNRERRAYTIEQRNDVTIMSNGSITLDTPTDVLLEMLAMALQAEEAQQGNNTLCDHMRGKLASNE